MVTWTACLPTEQLWTKSHFILKPDVLRSSAWSLAPHVPKPYFRSYLDLTLGRLHLSRRACFTAEREREGGKEKNATAEEYSGQFLLDSESIYPDLLW